MYQSKNALIVLNYNDSSTTSDFINMALRSESVEHIVVVDNCSSDDSYKDLKRFEGNRVDVIKTEKNGGYAYGNNCGCHYAIEKYNPKVLIVSNPDVTFENDVINHLTKVFEENNTIGASAPIVNQGYNMWDLPGFVGVIKSIFLLWFNIDKKRVKDRLTNSVKWWSQVGVVEGSLWAIRTEAYIQTGGFDEKTFLYYEENIFSKRLSDIGYIEASLNHCRYNHFHSISIKKRYGGKAKAFKHFHKSMLVYLEDYIKIGKVKKIIFEVAFYFGFLERLLYDCIMSVKRIKK